MFKLKHSADEMPKCFLGKKNSNFQMDFCSFIMLSSAIFMYERDLHIGDF